MTPAGTISDLKIRSEDPTERTDPKGLRTVEPTIRAILAEQGHLLVDAETISPDADLFEHGLTSHATVGVMLALEDQFDVEFPDEMLVKGTFESVDAIARSLQSLGATVSS
jgi:acyl carrier protein